MQRPSPRPRVRFTHVPKPGGVRVLAQLDGGLAAAYTSALAPLAPRIERVLGPEVLANRVADASDLPPALVLRPWRSERALLRRAVDRMVAGGLVLRTDVVACYPSISPTAVEETLRRCGGPPAAVRRCIRVLRELADEGVEGLPVGPPASAVLANAVLAAGDAALRRRGARFVRWVDDWWIAVHSAADAAEALAALGGGLAPAGLRLSDVKTRICGTDDPNGALSATGYHRAAHADALPLAPGSDAVVPGDGGMAAGRRAAHRARGQR